MDHCWRLLRSRECGVLAWTQRAMARSGCSAAASDSCLNNRDCRILETPFVVQWQNSSRSGLLEGDNCKFVNRIPTRFSFFKNFTVLRIKDNIFNKRSYFWFNLLYSNRIPWFTRINWINFFLFISYYRILNIHFSNINFELAIWYWYFYSDCSSSCFVKKHNSASILFRVIFEKEKKKWICNIVNFFISRGYLLFTRWEIKFHRG